MAHLSKGRFPSEAAAHPVTETLAWKVTAESQDVICKSWVEFLVCLGLLACLSAFL